MSTSNKSKAAAAPKKNDLGLPDGMTITDKSLDEAKKGGYFVHVNRNLKNPGKLKSSGISTYLKSVNEGKKKVADVTVNDMVYLPDVGIAGERNDVRQTLEALGRSKAQVSSLLNNAIDKNNYESAKFSSYIADNKVSRAEASRMDHGEANVQMMRLFANSLSSVRIVTNSNPSGEPTKAAAKKNVASAPRQKMAHPFDRIIHRINNLLEGANKDEVTTFFYATKINDNKPLRTDKPKDPNNVSGVAIMEAKFPFVVDSMENLDRVITAYKSAPVEEEETKLSDANVDRIVAKYRPMLQEKLDSRSTKTTTKKAVNVPSGLDVDAIVDNKGRRTLNSTEPAKPQQPKKQESSKPKKQEPSKPKKQEPSSKPQQPKKQEPASPPKKRVGSFTPVDEDDDFGNDFDNFDGEDFDEEDFDL